MLLNPAYWPWLPQSTSWSTLMKSEPIPATLKCSPSHLACPTDSFDNPLNPGPNTDQLPSIDNQGTRASVPTWVLGTSNPTWCPGHLSLHQCSGLAPMQNGYLVIPYHDESKPNLSFHCNPNSFPHLVISSWLPNPELIILVCILDFFTLTYLYHPMLDYDSKYERTFCSSSLDIL